MPKLTGPRVAPQSGKTRSLVILLHGYGADGADLIGLADPLGPALPDTAFRSPNAPQPCAINPGGRQWFPIPWIDGSTPQQMETGMRASVLDLDSYLTDAMAEEGVGPEQTCLIGFSQGTMMALHVAPRRPVAMAGIVGFSGRLAVPERLAAEVQSRPPVLLIHGDQDQVIPVAALAEAGDALSAAGFAVQTHVSRRTAHGIAPDGLQLAFEFLKARLG